MIELLIIVVSLFLGILVLLLFMFIEARKNHLTKHYIEFSTFPKSTGSLSIFFISDIHRRTISTRLLEKIPGKVDLVVIGGDLTESGVPFSRVEENIKLLRKLGPTFFVFGNNDYEVGKNELEALLIKNNITILNNSSTSFTSANKEKIALVGVEDTSKRRDKLHHALESTSSSEFKILISHNPDIYKKLNSKDGISIILSGHTHGGQIRFLGLGLYEKGKLHYLENAVLLVSNGYGTTSLPLRLGAPAEAHYLVLTSK
ncbi:metallophosphoesterase [Metabacillus litoralis]|uniref:metallophosphoesterase n=1 Tax=Metabacillus litoralis TaxID=152268 RepID=UPI001E54C8F0|nr:metallophosphoesterase [Metabacillus litoralis]UHA58075.1 metallophosphoesterase [Metabacillus litoralis]